MSLDNTRNRSYEETLSALMDNEAEELELRRLLKDMPNDKALAETWKRFHVARSVLHNEDMVVLSDAASSRILAAIADEPEYSSVGKDENKSSGQNVSPVWMLSAGKLAVAASVALAVFLGFQSTLVEPDTDFAVAKQTTSSHATSSHESMETIVASATDREVVEFDANAQHRLNDYIQSVSIQYGDDTAVPQFNILQDSQLIRQVNQIEN